MPMQHLLKQVEIYGAKRANRDSRPEWIAQLVETVADLFEPADGEGRVGFDCHPTADCWEVGLYLGSLEFIGGMKDGSSQFANFHFDVLAFLELFSEVEMFRWNSYPSPTELDLPKETPPSFLTIEGKYDENLVRVNIYTIPPAESGPGFRQYPDGSIKPA